MVYPYVFRPKNGIPVCFASKKGYTVNAFRPQKGVKQKRCYGIYPYVFPPKKGIPVSSRPKKGIPLMFFGHKRVLSKDVVTGRVSALNRRGRRLSRIHRAHTFISVRVEEVYTLLFCQPTSFFGPSGVTSFWLLSSQTIDRQALSRVVRVLANHNQHYVEKRFMYPTTNQWYDRRKQNPNHAVAQGWLRSRYYSTVEK